MVGLYQYPITAVGAGFSSDIFVRSRASPAAETRDWGFAEASGREMAVRQVLLEETVEGWAVRALRLGGSKS